MQNRLLDVKHLKTNFHTQAGIVQAVRDVSFYVNEEECVGIVGESGCGKSVTMLSIMRLCFRKRKYQNIPIHRYARWTGGSSA